MVRVLLFALIAISALATQPQAQLPRAQAEGVVRDLLEGAHDALNRRHDVKRLSRILDQSIAFDLWTRFLLADRKSAFTKEQKRRFRALLPRFMANLYANQFNRGLSHMPHLGDTRRVRRDMMVGSFFSRRDGHRLPVEWRVRRVRGEGFQIIDIMIGGTSFVLLKREEFNDIVDRRGPDGLLEYLKHKAR